MKKILITICACMDVISIAHADTETINWYVDNSIYDTTTCQTGGDIILPTTPTKRGYTFHGWISGIYDMSTLDTSVNGEIYYSRNADNTCYYLKKSEGTYHEQACILNDYSDLALREWKVLFNYGLVRGESACSTTVGVLGDTGLPDLSNPSSGGQYCWCRVTGFIPTGGYTVRKTAVSHWTFSYTRASASSCASDCARNCGYGVRGDSSLRASLYGSHTD